MKRIKRFFIILIAFLLIMGAAEIFAAETDTEGGPAGIPDGPAAVKDKDEVVYARLFENGNVRSIYVVNHFTLSGGGVITDYGGYTSVLNLTDLQPVALSGGTVKVGSTSENFYYQGYLAGTDLPWLYRIEYFMNGSPANPAEIAGKSGRLEIRLSSTRNPAVSEVFFYNYMQQITITLDGDKCANIAADGAAVANAGKNRMLVFTVLPKQNADIIVTADVRDFEMAGIDITAMPFSMSFDIPDIGDMLGGLYLLTDAIVELKDGVGKLDDGVSEMAAGSELLRAGSGEFLGGLTQLSANSSMISDASAQINGALSMIAASLTDSGDMPDIGLLTRLPDVLNLLTSGLNRVSTGLIQLKDSYGQAYAALDEAIASITGYQTDEAQMRRLYDKADAGERELLDKIMEDHLAALTVKEAYSQTKPVLASVGGTLDSLSSTLDSSAELLRDMATLISGALTDFDIMSQLDQLTNGMSELSRNYAEFHSGVVAFMQGVTEAAAGYAELDEGIAGLNGGVSELTAGILELYNGTIRLAEETTGMPGQIDTMVGSLMSDYTSSGFAPVSFVSEKNDGVSFVQFVFKTEGISKPQSEKTAIAEAAQLNFWDRLLKLFAK